MRNHFKVILGLCALSVVGLVVIGGANAKRSSKAGTRVPHQARDARQAARAFRVFRVARAAGNDMPDAARARVELLASQSAFTIADTRAVTDRRQAGVQYFAVRGSYGSAPYICVVGVIDEGPEMSIGCTPQAEAISDGLNMSVGLPHGRAEVVQLFSDRAGPDVRDEAGRKAPVAGANLALLRARKGDRFSYRNDGHSVEVTIPGA